MLVCSLSYFVASVLEFVSDVGLYIVVGHIVFVVVIVVLVSDVVDCRLYLVGFGVA